MNSYIPDDALDNTVLDFDYDVAIRSDAPLERISGASTRTVDNDSWYGDHFGQLAYDDLESYLYEPGAPSDIMRAVDVSLDTTSRETRLSGSGAYGPSIYNSSIYTPHNSINHQASNEDEDDTSSYPLEPWSTLANDVQTLPGTLAYRTSVSPSSGLWRSGAKVSPLRIPYSSSPIYTVASTTESHGGSEFRHEHTALPKIEVSSYSQGASPVDKIAPQRIARMDGSYRQLQIGSLPSTFGQKHEQQDWDWDQLQPWNLSSGTHHTSPSSGESSAPAEALTCPKCPIDERRPFRRAGDYRRHLKKHDVPLHKCSFVGCDRTFYRHDKLKAHVEKAHNMDLSSMGDAESTSSRSATPRAEEWSKQEALYTCAKCGYEFRRQLDFEKHYERKHVRRHECDKCKASFNLKADLERHKNTVHQVGPRTRYRCTKPDCSQEFPRKDNLLRHIKRMHPDEGGEFEASNTTLSSSMPIAPKPPSVREFSPGLDSINHKSI